MRKPVTRGTKVRTAALLTIAALLSSFPARGEEPLPEQAHIEGVPFIGYHEVRDATFPGSEVLNPSFTAAVKMMFVYWGGDFEARARAKTELAGWKNPSGDHAALSDLKALLARGIPVYVVPATTPEAQRLYPIPKICASLQKVSYTEPRATSGALGEMIPLAAVEQLRAGGCGAGLNDSVYVAAKLLIGYDDTRQVLIMHDPSLGPDLELGYDSFERMWRATEARYQAEYPDPLPATPPGRVSNVRARTADDQAAVSLFRAYGLEVAGRYPEAEPLLREALALDGLSAGRRHLLGLELAVVLNETGRCAEAIAAARRANADFGDYALGHALLAHLLACSGDRAAQKEAKREKSLAKSLCSTAAQRRVADELGRDFHVVGCNGEMLGWYRP